MAYLAQFCVLDFCTNLKVKYMKRFLLSIFSLVIALSVFADTYTHKFANGDLKTEAGTVVLSGYEWSASAANLINWNSNGKGVQLGSKASPCTSYTLSSTAFSEFKIKSVTVNSSIASSGDAKLTIKVGDKSSEAFELTTSDAPYTFDCDGASGEIAISWTASQRAYYVSQITIELLSTDVPAPLFITPEGVYADEIMVIARTDVQTDVIYYTIDGTTPSYEDYTNDTGTTKSSRTYEINEKLKASATIKAMAVRTDGEAAYFSKVVEAHYIVSPTVPYQQATEVVSGSKYAILAADTVAMPVALGKGYDYLAVDTVVAHEKYIETVEYFGFTFEAAEGGYTIKDAEGRYLYMSGNYNNFNVSATMPSEGAVWSVAIAEDGTAAIKNVAKDKTIYYSQQYRSYGCYAADKVTSSMIQPKLYLQREYPKTTIDPAENTVMKVFQTITISCPNGIKAADDLKVEISGFGVTLSCTQIDENTISLSTAEPFTTNDNSNIMVYFTGDIFLEPNGMCIPMKFKHSRLMYEVQGNAAPAKITNITPASGATVEELSYILFEFDNYVGIDTNSDEAHQPKLHAEGSSELIAVEYTTDNKAGTGKVGHYEGALRVSEPIVANGTYILEIPTGYFIDRNGNQVEGVTLKYTVKNDGTGIAGVEAQGGACTVYSLSGVKLLEAADAARLGELPAGIYIVNGTKVIVK